MARLEERALLSGVGVADDPDWFWTVLADVSLAETSGAAWESTVEAEATPVSMPRAVFDALVRPSEAPAADAPLGEDGSPQGQVPLGATSADTSEYMLGDVWVTVVLLESSGVIDAQTENWSPARIAQVKSEVQEGLTWWQDTLHAQFPSAPHDLTFQIDFTYADSPVETRYEPITRPQSQQGLWIDDFLNAVGYNTPSSIFGDLDRWNDAQRQAHDTHWAYTVFVVDSLNDSDGMFSDNYFAYAYLGGPFAVMTYDNDGWGIGNMGMVLAHETGHIFYALDEYAGSDSTYTDHSGYYNTQNLNAYEGNPNPSGRVASLMADASLQFTAYASHTSSPTSLQMLGWRDSDGDGVFDVLDVPLTLTGTGSYNRTTGRYEFSGTSAVGTLANLNPNSAGHAITLNTVDVLQYRLDGGAWTDGNTYGTYTANVSQSVAITSGSSHTIEFRTIVLQTGVTSAVWSDTFTATGLVITETGGSTAVTEGGATDSYTVQLSDQPSANVTVTIAPDAQLSVSAASLVFTPTDWNAPRTITVTAVDDTVSEGPHSSTIAHTAASADPMFNGTGATVTAAITDNDNRAPSVAAPIADVSVQEDASNTVISLAGVFSDPDVAAWGDSLTFTVTVTTPVSSIADDVSQSSYLYVHQDLLYTTPGNDRGFGAQHDLARTNIFNYFESLGLSTRLDPFLYGGQTYYNVVATKTGTSRPSDIFIVGAHYDSVNNPGADDNGSGTAAVMEIARVLSQYEFDATIVFIAFDREEQGLYGSAAYAAAALQRGDRILGVVNLDMIAYNPAGAHYNQVQILDGDGQDEQLKSALIAAFNTYGYGNGVTAVNGGSTTRSDHYPFDAAGYDAALIIEYNWGSNPYYHTASDHALATVGGVPYIDYTYAANVSAGAAGYLASAAGPVFTSSLLTVSIVGGQLVLDYQPDANGQAVITIRATDQAGAWVEDTFTVTTSPVNDAPTVAQPIADATVGGTAVTVDLSQTFSDADIAKNHDWLTLSVVGNSGAGLVSAAISGTTLTLARVGTQGGTADVTIRATDLSGAYVEDTFRVTVDGTAPAVVVIDDGATGFSTVGAWRSEAVGYQGDLKWVPGGDGSAVATWSFTGLAPGTYQVSVTWYAAGSNASNAPFSMYDGTTLLGTVAVNQKAAPAGFSEGGVTWQNLTGTYTITGSTLTVRLSNLANAAVVADGVRVEKVGSPAPQPAPVLSPAAAADAVFGDARLLAWLSEARYESPAIPRRGPPGRILAADAAMVTSRPWGGT